MGFGFEGVAVVAFYCAGRYAVFAGADVVFFGFYYLEGYLHSFVFFVLEVVVAD